MRRFDPIHLDADRHPTTASVTLMAKHAACPRSSYLYLQHDGGAASHAMIRGTAIHTAIERCLLTMMLEGESRIEGDLAREIANEVISEGILLNRETDPFPCRVAIPFEEHDYIRMSLFRWSEFFAVDPKAIVGVERMFELDVAGRTVRGKLDLAYVEGDTLVIKDWKSSRAMPAQDEFASVRPDGKLAPKQFAPVMYALLARYGSPVEWAECPDCLEPTADPQAMGCEWCEGRGGRWQPLDKWPTAQRYELSLIFPGIETPDGMGERGPLVLEERDLHDFRRALEGQVKTFEGRLVTGDWPAVPSTDGCAECPCKPECPIPAHLRDFNGAIDSHEQAEQFATALYVAKKQHADVQKALRAYAKAEGLDLIRCAEDRAYAFTTRESTETDWGALQAATASGGPVDLDVYRKRRASTSFVDRKLEPHERGETA